MMWTARRFYMLELFLVCLAFGWPTAVHAQVTASIAEIKSVRGKVEVLKKGEMPYARTRPGRPLFSPMTAAASK
jgi:hypothetical protein